MSKPRPARMRYISFDKIARLWAVRPIIRGKRLRAVYFAEDELEDAIQYRDEIMAESHQGDPTVPGAETVADLCRRWLRLRQQEVKSGDLAINTYRDYERVVRLHIADSDLGRRRLRENLTPAIRELLAAKDEEGLAPSYRRRILVVLRQVLDLGERDEIVRRNYAKQVKPPRQRQPEPDAWTEGEAKQFLTATADSDHNLLWRFMLETGARMGEACGIRWEDIDLDSTPAVVSFVQQRLRSRAGEPMFGILKTERSRRDVSIVGPLVDRLRQHREDTAELRELNGWNLVFLSRFGTPLDLPNVGRQWRADVRRSKVRYVKPHVTRSTHATITLDRGVPLEEVSRRLGHSTTSFTADVYKKFRGSTATAAALHIAEALAGEDEWPRDLQGIPHNAASQAEDNAV